MTNKQLLETFFPPLPPSTKTTRNERRKKDPITWLQKHNELMALLRLTGRGTDLPASKQFHEKRKTKKKKKKKFERPFQLSRVIHLVAFLTINPPPGARKKLSDGQQLKFVPVFTGETINERHCSRLFFATCVVRGWWFCKWRDWARLVIWITLDPFLFSPSFCSL